MGNISVGDGLGENLCNYLGQCKIAALDHCGVQMDPEPRIISRSATVPVSTLDMSSVCLITLL